MRRPVALLCLLLLAAGCSDDSTMAPEEAGVFLNSRRPIYRPGDALEFFLLNGTDHSIAWSSCGGHVDWYERSGNEWTNVSGLCAEWPPHIELISPRRTLKIFTNYYTGSPQGEYRVGAYICDEKGENCETVFSDPFLLHSN